MNVTYFQKLTEPKSLKHLPLKTILDGIKSPKQGSPVKEIVEKIRQTPDKELRDALKKSLPVVCFSGTFSERRASALQQYSKVICMDIDNLECPDDTKEELSKNPYVHAVWLSPTGNGLKVLVRVATENHLGHALALLRDFRGVDENAIKDVNRCAFMSTDEALFYNPDSQIYANIVIPKHTDEDKYTALKKWLENKGNKFVNGQRNSFVTKLSAAANRFGVDKDFLKQRLEDEFLQGSDFSRREMDVTVNGIYERYTDQHNTVNADEIWTDKKVNEVLAVAEFKLNDVITVHDIREDLIKDYDEGTVGGDTTFFPLLDKHFRFMRGEQTTITGISSAGKSTMLTHLLCIRAALRGEKFGFLSMEQYPPVYFYRELVRMIVGKPLERDHPQRMSKAEYERGLEWVHSKFFFIYPESSDPTPEWTLARFYEVIMKYAVDGVIVDPHNSQSHDYKSAGGRDDRYISSMLRKNERFALQNDVYFFNVAHPKGIGKKDDGTYREPAADDISGGPAWWQCNDNILVHHRQNLPVDYKDPSCTLKSVKIKKQPMNGTPGTVNFMYDWKSGRFMENGYNPLTGFKL